MTGSKHRLIAALMALALVVLTGVVLSACGGSSSETASAETTSTEAAESTGSEESESTEGETAAAGSSSEVTGKKVGFINITRACEACVRAEVAFDEAAKEFNWSVKGIDGQGDPTTIDSQCNTLVVSGIEAIVLQSVDPESIGDCLAKAKSANIPVVDQALGGAYNASYLAKGLTSVSDFNAAVESGLISEAFFAKINEKINNGEIEGKAQIAVFSGTPSISIHRLRYATFQAFLAENKESVEVVTTHSTDLTNAQSDVENTMKSVLTAHPDLAGVWTIQDIEAVPTVAALEAAGSNAIVTTYFGDKPILQNIREEGNIYATVDAPLELLGYESADTLAKYFTGKPYSTAPSLTLGANAMPVVYTAENAPAEGAPVHPDPQIQKYQAAWKTEYGL
jgi:ribose transport system substrate-binding protein